MYWIIYILIFFHLFYLIYSLDSQRLSSTSSNITSIKFSSKILYEKYYKILSINYENFNNTMKKNYKDYLKLPWCTPDNLILNKLSDYDGDWYLNIDGSFSYHFSHCKLKIFTRSQAYHCLKGHHLGFVGDSLTRYFALNLMYLFSHNKWSNRLVNKEDHYYDILKYIKKLGKNIDSIKRKEVEKFKEDFIKNRNNNKNNNNINNKKNNKNNLRRLYDNEDEKRKLEYYKYNNINNYLNFHSWIKFYEGASEILNNEDNEGISREICDCYSSETDRRDNHFFRYINKNYINDLNEKKNENDTISLIKKFEIEIINDVRISSILWYGNNIISGDKSLTFSPYITKQFNKYKNEINEIKCRNNYKFIPFNSKCDRSYIGNDFDDSYSTSACDSYEYNYIDNYSSFDHTNSCEKFDREILGGLGITNLIINFGLHVHQINQTSLNLIKKTINASRKYLLPPRNSNRINLSQVVWRDTTATTSILTFEDEVITLIKNKTLNSWKASKNLNNQRNNNIYENLNLNEEFNSTELSTKSYGLGGKYTNNNIEEIEGENFHKVYVNNLINPYYSYNFNSSFSLQNKYVLFNHTISQDDMKLDRFNIYNITNKLIKIKKFIKMKQYELDFLDLHNDILKKEISIKSSSRILYDKENFGLDSNFSTINNHHYHHNHQYHHHHDHHDHHDHHHHSYNSSFNDYNNNYPLNLEFQDNQDNSFGEFEKELEDFSIFTYKQLKENVDLSSLLTFDNDLITIQFNLLPNIFIDYNHFESWVYNEINNIFLNAVCPQVEENYNSEWDIKSFNY